MCAIDRIGMFPHLTFCVTQKKGLAWPKELEVNVKVGDDSDIPQEYMYWHE